MQGLHTGERAGVRPQQAGLTFLAIVIRMEKQNEVFKLWTKNRQRNDKKMAAYEFDGEKYKNLQLPMRMENHQGGCISRRIGNDFYNPCAYKDKEAYRLSALF